MLANGFSLRLREWRPALPGGVMMMMIRLGLVGDKLSLERGPVEALLQLT